MKLRLLILAGVLGATLWPQIAFADTISFTKGRYAFDCTSKFAGFIKKQYGSTGLQPGPISAIHREHLKRISDRCRADMKKAIDDLIKRDIEEPQRTNGLRELETCERFFGRFDQNSREASSLLTLFKKDCCGAHITGPDCR